MIAIFSLGCNVLCLVAVLIVAVWVGRIAGVVEALKPAPPVVIRNPVAQQASEQVRADLAGLRPKLPADYLTRIDVASIEEEARIRYVRRDG